MIETRCLKNVVTFIQTVISCWKSVAEFEDDKKFERRPEFVFIKPSVLKSDRILTNTEE